MFLLRLWPNNERLRTVEDATGVRRERICVLLVLYAQELRVYPGGTVASVTEATSSLASHQKGSDVVYVCVNSRKLPDGYKGMAFLLPEAKEIQAEFEVIDEEDVMTTYHIKLTGAPPPIKNVRPQAEHFGYVPLQPFEYHVSNQAGVPPLWKRMEDRVGCT